MKFRANFVSNSSSASFVIQCRTEEDLKCVMKVVDKYMKLINSMDPGVDGPYTFKREGNTASVYTEDGDSFSQMAIDKLFELLKWERITDTEGCPITDIKTERIYMG